MAWPDWPWPLRFYDMYASGSDAFKVWSLIIGSLPVCNHCWVRRWKDFENCDICRNYGQESSVLFIWLTGYNCHSCYTANIIIMDLYSALLTYLFYVRSIKSALKISYSHCVIAISMSGGGYEFLFFHQKLYSLVRVEIYACIIVHDNGRTTTKCYWYTDVSF